MESAPLANVSGPPRLRGGAVSVHPRNRLGRHHFTRLLLVVTGLTGTAGAAGAAVSLEYRVKAAYLYNFVKFTEWPAEAFRAPGTPYHICVLGSDPFGPDLEAAAQDHLVRERRIAIRRIARVESAGGCHVVYVAASERARLGDIIRTLASAPTLTVGDDQDFIRRGGCVRFYLVENRVRFEINLAAADRARLRLSAKLLSLARVVGRSTKG